MKGLGKRFSDVGSIARASDWWSSKMPTLLAAFYAPFILTGRPIVPAWREGLVLLAALVVGATYVSIINDLADIREDRAAGKPNRLAGRPRRIALSMVLIVALVASGVAFAYHWRDDPALVLVYVAAWLSFTAYSLSPLRLKECGFAGLMADACGAHLFPSLTAALVAFRAAGVAPWPFWTGVLAVWALGTGLRSILGHQLRDADADRRSGSQTFVQRVGENKARRCGERLFFPLELITLFALLALLPGKIPALGLAAYSTATIIKLQARQWSITLVEPRSQCVTLLADYYVTLLPLSLLLAATSRHPQDAAVLLTHLILFAPILLSEATLFLAILRARGLSFALRGPDRRQGKR
ncbi:UbiA family prenyltransferase [Sphingomonas immobilis]|uniref:UbiA family prenyltransferase n=1 Tax=Sphingomonas immobilis TaxID=3063997 RepID=A0ABT8ZZF9_9SPHN|nr:UbiA family prenyltransferase [Sphingomonas sp. CA1-15]MDO7841837.1 UbiA family prenyltransferase [Sphingomonas sp. CA1-15]